MSEIFSNQRLIDYFMIFDYEIVKLNETYEKIEKMNIKETGEDYIPINCQYKHRKLNIYPKKLYNEKNFYELELNSIFQMIPSEYVYLRKPPNKFFSLIFTNSKKGYYII